MKKTIVLALDSNDLTGSHVTYLKEQAFHQFNVLLKNLSITKKNGAPVLVEIYIDDLNPTSMHFFNAYAAASESGNYVVHIGGGLLARIEALSRALAHSEALRASTKSKLLGKDAKKDGRKKVVENFAFHYLLGLVFWHEVSHIVLGHVDWIRLKNSGMEMLSEFFVNDLSAPDAADRRALEGDADRQATLWSAQLFDRSLKTNPFLRYLSDADAFYDFGYLTASLFLLFEALNKGGDPTLRAHPRNHERICVLLAFTADYLDKNRRDAAIILTTRVTTGAIDATFEFPGENKEVMDIRQSMMFVTENERELSRLQIQNHAHTISPGIISSFLV